MTELLQRLETARAEKRRTLIASLRHRLNAARPTPTAVVLFGSIARGNFDGRSDIDLVVIGEASGAHEALVDIARPIDLVPIPVTNWQRRLADNDRFVTGVRQEGVLLVGTWPDRAATQ
jgi:predicted nucleotidyltransferase